MGEHDRISGEPLPDHISARWPDVEPLMDGLIAAQERMVGSDMDAVVVAAMIAFVVWNLPGHAFPVVMPKDTTADSKERYKPLEPFAVPFGTFNVALHKPVTSSDDSPIIGELAMITDAGTERPVR